MLVKGIQVKVSQMNTLTPHQHAANWLAKSDLRPTKQRLCLAELLVGDGKDRHVTAETLFESAKNANVSVSLATIYNTLTAFCEAGLIREILVDGQRSYFDTCVTDHSHFYIEDTGELSDAPLDAISISRLPNIPEGMEISKIDVVVRLRRR